MNVSHITCIPLLLILLKIPDSCISFIRGLSKLLISILVTQAELTTAHITLFVIATSQYCKPSIIKNNKYNVIYNIMLLCYR